MRLRKVRFECKYLTIQSFYDEKHWSINWMCKELGVSHAAYYKWLNREIPAEELENQKIAELIREYDDRFWGIIKTEMYAMYEITDEASLRDAIVKYLHFYTYERPQERFNGKTPAEVRQEALLTDTPKDYPIAENKRIKKYKGKWAA